VRTFPPVAGDWKEWARSLTRSLQFGWQQLDHKNADSRATQDGILLWDPSASEVVVSDAGAWVAVGGAGGATDLTYTAATRLLESSTGTDVTLPLVTTSNAGLAPATGGGTDNFLRADATFALPPGTATTTLIVENRTSDPGSPAVGQLWIRTDL
jgi:hypothetical protein